METAPTPSTSVAITRTPTPGTARPKTRVAAGVANSSTKRNAQTSAATLTMSGTVTKKPVMKLRRNHCIVQVRPEVSHYRTTTRHRRRLTQSRAAARRFTGESKPKNAAPWRL